MKIELLMAALTTIAHMPASSEQVTVLAESANVHIVRGATAGGIAISTNCPRNWSAKDGVIRQVGFAKPRGGVSMMADALGSRAIVNGKIYLLPSPMRGGLSMGADGVKLAGEKLDPLVGTDMPGSCGSNMDSIEITVPETYAGNLQLGLSANSSAVVDGWTGGNFECTLVGESTISAGKLKSLSKAVLDLRGDGKAEIGDISTKVLVANVTGNGKILVKAGNASVSNATVTGNGSIIMNGKFANLKKAVENGQGTIQIGP